MHTSPTPLPATIRCIAFDLDGTLVDSVPDIAAAANAALDQMGLGAYSSDAYRGWIGNGVKMLMSRALAAAQVDGAAPDKPLLERATAAFETHYAHWNGKLSAPYPHAHALLEYLADAGYTLACVTNKPHQFAVDLLALHGFAERFRFVLGGDSLPRHKPDPLPLMWVAEQLSLSPDALLMVGDSATDILTAQAAGAPVVAVSYGYNRGQDLRELGPAHVIDSLDELQGLLARA